MTLATRLALACCATVALGFVACSSAPTDARIGIDAPPRDQFDAVGKFLDHRCGSLDCHGNPQRNLVIWGAEGLRLDKMDLPGTPSRTSVAELDATYRSVVALEPAVMSAVVEGGGKHPELLTLVRKARGTENHKGGALVVPGDQQDVCIASWLAGSTNQGACADALNNTP